MVAQVTDFVAVLRDELRDAERDYAICLAELRRYQDQREAVRRGLVTLWKRLPDEVRSRLVAEGQQPPGQLR